MENTQDTHISLITRYLSGESGPEEVGRLAAWIDESPENASLFKSLHKAWLMENTANQPIEDTKKEWDKLQLRLKRNQRASFRRQLYSIPFRIAAILVVFAIAAGIIWFVSSRENNIRLIAGNTRQTFTLPDGSHITLQKGSQVNYPAAFGKKERKISITGQAYLEIAHDTVRPFTALAGNLEIRVTGTTFYLSSQMGNQNPVVVLTEGRVKAYPAGQPQKARNLVPGESAWLEGGNDVISVQTQTDPNLISWNTLKFTFNSTPLAEVVAILAQSYAQKVTLAGKGLENCTLTATFEKQELANVLTVITSALSIRWESRQDDYVLYGNSCQ